MILRIAIAGACLTLVSSCGRDEGVPSAEQNRDMDEAAEMLDRAPNSLAAVQEDGLDEQAENRPAEAPPSEPVD